VKFTVDPDVTEVGPLQVIAGAVPVLWQEVQVEPLFPEYPETPPGYALAGVVKEAIIHAARKMNSS
jgi:hypothetical protein